MYLTTLQGVGAYERRDLRQLEREARISAQEEALAASRRRRFAVIGATVGAIGVAAFAVWLVASRRPK